MEDEMTTKRKGMRLRRHFTIAVIAILELFGGIFSHNCWGTGRLGDPWMA
jgi:hypothetical protein